MERVRDLLGTLAKAQKDYKTYPRNNPVLRKRRDELIGKFGAILGTVRELPLSVDAERLLFEGAAVYENADRRESIAFHLYRQGIREIRFVSGLAPEEIDGLLDSINTDFSREGSELDDDLITVLWTRDLPHFRWDAIDDVDPKMDWVRDPATALQSYLVAQREMPGDEKFVNALRLEGSAPARDPRGDLQAIQLHPSEIAQVRLMIEEDGKRDLAIQVIEILTRVLRETTDPNEAANLLRILDRVIEISVEQRSFNRAATTLQILGELVRTQPSLASAVRGTIAKFGEPKAVKQLIEIVSKPEAEGWAPIDDVDLFRYLIQLTKSAVVPLAEAMGVLQDRRLRKTFCEALAELVKNDVNLLAGLSRDNRWFVARNVAYILGLTKNPESLKVLRSLNVHPNEKVRVEAVRAAGMMGSGAKDIVQRALSDADRSVRMLAFELIGAFADAATAPMLLQQVEAKVFDEKDGAEKRALALALARVAGEHALAPLSKILVRPSGMMGSKDESRNAAAAGIAAIGTKTSTEYLRSGANAPDPVLSAICIQAMREAKLE